MSAPSPPPEEEVRPEGPSIAAEPGDAPVESAAGPAIAGAGALGQLGSESFDVLAAVGGWRGLVESVAPGLVFVIVFVATRDLMPTLIASLAVAALAALARIVQRGSLTSALSGLLGVLIGVVWAWRSGDAGDFFVWGLWVNVAYLAAFLISVAVRRPLIGMLVAVIQGTWATWRSSAAFGRYVIASLVWAALFALRLAVQVPLYLAGEVAWLGTARLAMGLPLFALAAYVTWLLVREPASAAPPTDSDPPSNR